MTKMRVFQRHPFPVVARFDRVVALSFAFPEDVLRPLIPGGLDLDTYDGFGFLTVAMVWTRDLRPAGFPAALGRNFFLAGYRIFARMIFIEPTRAGRWISWSLAGFWLIRLYCQWFVYRRELWRGKRLETSLHFWMTLVWVSLTAVITACGLAQTQWWGIF